MTIDITNFINTEIGFSDALRKNMALELTQCPRCQTYTDDPEHWCGSVALVRWKDTPWFSTVI